MHHYRCHFELTEEAVAAAKEKIRSFGAFVTNTHAHPSSRGFADAFSEDDSLLMQRYR